jgi:hypothetical protein
MPPFAAREALQIALLAEFVSLVGLVAASFLNQVALPAKLAALRPRSFPSAAEVLSGECIGIQDLRQNHQGIDESRPRAVHELVAIHQENPRTLPG